MTSIPSLSDPYSFSSLRDLWRDELYSFRSSLDACRISFPDICAYEFTHAIMHITVSYYRQPRSAHSRDLKNACDHVRRAHLDFLKILISYIHGHLETSDIAKNLCFQKDKIKARLLELIEIGGTHTDTIREFRLIIEQYWSQDIQVLPTKPEFKTLVGRTTAEEKLSAFNARTAKLPLPEHRHLLLLWARLDSIVVSLYGNKLYSFYYKLLDSYIEFENLAESIRGQIAELKLWIIGLALQLDHQGELSSALNRYDAYVGIIKPTIDELKRTDYAPGSVVPFQPVIENIEESFKLVEEFLGFSGDGPF